MVKSSEQEFLKIPKSLKWSKKYTETPRLIHLLGRKLVNAIWEVGVGVGVERGGLFSSGKIKNWGRGESITTHSESTTARLFHGLEILLKCLLYHYCHHHHHYLFELSSNFKV